MLVLLELTVAAGGVAGAGLLSWRAVRELYDGAREAAHGATNARQRIWARQMRIFALSGLLLVILGALAGVRGAFAPGHALGLSAGMLAFGFLSWMSARAAGRASRRTDERGGKRAHVEARMRAHRWRERRERRRRQQQAGTDRESGQRRRRRRASGRPSGHQHSRGEQRRAEGPSRRQRALRVLGLPAGATADEIKRAWRAQAFRHHPDRHVRAGEAAQKRHAEAFRRARRAYETLCRPRPAYRRRRT